MSVFLRVVSCLLFMPIVLAGCGATHGDQGGPIQASASPVTHATAPLQKHRHPHHVPHKAHASRRPSSCPSPSHALDGIYHPSRLQVLDSCRWAEGTVALVRHEEDGDLHIDV